MKLTIEGAFKVLNGVAEHPSLTLNKAEHVLISNSLILIKETLGLEDEEVETEEVEDEKTNH